MKGLGAAAQVDVGEYAGYIEALEERRRFFISRGATSADHSHLDAAAEPLETAEAQRIYYSAMSGRVTPRRQPRSAGTWCWRWPGCRATTAW